MHRGERATLSIGCDLLHNVASLCKFICKEARYGEPKKSHYLLVLFGQTDRIQ